MIRMGTSSVDAPTLGRLLNGLGIFASQLLFHNRPDFYDRSKNNLIQLKNQNETLFKLLDDQAEHQQDEKPLLLIEDILRYTRQDAAGCLLLARRCLLACAFIGDVMAKSARAAKPEQAADDQRSRIH